jgi:hypothetical protein
MDSPRRVAGGVLGPVGRTARGCGWSGKGSRLRLLMWSLAAGSGTVRTNKGRSITSAAVDPPGTLIAVSETTMLNIGSARDGAGTHILKIPD